MIGSTGRQVKDRRRVVFNVPVTSGNYATESIVIGRAPDSGDAPENYAGVTILLENGGSIPAGATVELWLPRVSGEPDNSPSSDDTVVDYHHSGQVVGPVGTAATPTGMVASFGSLTYALAGWPGCMVRVKGAGIPGPVTVSVTAF